MVSQRHRVFRTIVICDVARTRLILRFSIQLLTVMRNISSKQISQATDRLDSFCDQGFIRRSSMTCLVTKLCHWFFMFNSNASKRALIHVSMVSCWSLSGRSKSSLSNRSFEMWSPSRGLPGWPIGIEPTTNRFTVCLRKQAPDPATAEGARIELARHA